MNIVWFTWKDLDHPLAGGAEVVNQELAKRLVADGHQVKFIVGGFNGSKPTKNKDGYQINRVGGRVSVYYKAWRFYKQQNLQQWTDLVIDEVNTVPFFAKFYSKRTTILFIHQLARQIWFYELPKPIGFIGYILEPLYLRILSNQKVITVSKSTKKDLIVHGFKLGNIKIISEGLQIKPITKLNSKPSIPTIISLGAIKPMKRTIDQIKAFELAKTKIPKLKLVIAGALEGSYGQKVIKYTNKSPYKVDIKYLGKIGINQMVKLLQSSHVIVSTSIKEGWGLTITEAASQGTPAVVYDVDGLRDSVRNNWSGCIVSNSQIQELTEKIEKLLRDTKFYNKLRKNGWQWSKQINFDLSYAQFKKAISL